MKQPSRSSNKIRGALFLLLRLALGVIFIYSGYIKIMHPIAFLDNVYAYELTGPRFGLWVAVLIPALEFLTGAALILNVVPSGATLVTCLLCMIFLGAQGSAVWRDLNISCGCFGAAHESFVGKLTLLRTAAIFGMSFIAFVLAITNRPASSIINSNPDSPAIASPRPA